MTKKKKRPFCREVDEAQKMLLFSSLLLFNQIVASLNDSLNMCIYFRVDEKGGSIFWVYFFVKTVRTGRRVEIAKTTTTTAGKKRWKGNKWEATSFDKSLNEHKIMKHKHTHSAMNT